MRGRAKGNQERIILTAHQGEIFARMKTIRPDPGHYLRPKKQKSQAGAPGVLAMLRRMKAKQDKKGTQDG